MTTKRSQRLDVSNLPIPKYTSSHKVEHSLNTISKKELDNRTDDQPILTRTVSSNGRIENDNKAMSSNGDYYRPMTQQRKRSRSKKQSVCYSDGDQYSGKDDPVATPRPDKQGGRMWGHPQCVLRE